MKKVLICANFGKSDQTSSGQIIKSKLLKEELIKTFGESEISIHNTAYKIRGLILLLVKVLIYLKEHKNIIIMPAYNGIRIITPIFSFINRFYHRNLSYVVIGGWLPSFLDKRPSLKMILTHFDGIYVETYAMKEALEQMGFENVFVMRNFKLLNAVRESDLVPSNSSFVRLCTFSRVMKEKGVEDAIQAVVELNKEFNRVLFALDIYGEIENVQKDWFNGIEKNFPDYIKYRGLVSFNESVNVLKDYYALLFPTYYEGEGVAGTLIDAMAAGIPSVVSDWKYNSEIIENGKNGYLFKTRNVEDLKDKIRLLFIDKEKYGNMRKSALCEYCKYTPGVAMPILLSHLS